MSAKLIIELKLLGIPSQMHVRRNYVSMKLGAFLNFSINFVLLTLALLLISQEQSHG